MGSSNTAPDIVVDSLQTDALLGAPMTAALTLDVNGDTLADAGDRIAYTTMISNPDDAFDAASPGTAFSLVPDADSSLVAGSVTTTQGTVANGNGAGDTSVSVDAGTIADGASVTVAATVQVLPGPTSPLSVQGTVTSDSLTALRTDDPAVAGASESDGRRRSSRTRRRSRVDDAYSVVGGQTLTVDAAAGVLDNDTDDDGDALTAVGPVGPAHGQLTLNADGSFTYTPDAGYTGADSFTYRADDGLAQSPPATVTITVTAPPRRRLLRRHHRHHRRHRLRHHYLRRHRHPRRCLHRPPGICQPVIVLTDVERSGGRVTVAGIARSSLAGRKAMIEALVGSTRLGSPAAATIARDGSFAATMPLPGALASRLGEVPRDRGREAQRHPAARARAVIESQRDAPARGSPAGSPRARAVGPSRSWPRTARAAWRPVDALLARRTLQHRPPVARGGRLDPVLPPAGLDGRLPRRTACSSSSERGR